MNRKTNHRASFAAFSLLATASLLVACSSDSAQSASMITGGTVTPTAEINITISGTATPEIVNTLPTPTPAEPPPTAKPDTAGLAARVNGRNITLDQFNTELARYIAADPAAPSPDSPEGMQLAAQLKDTVLEALIDQMLIEQEAERVKVTVTEQQVDEELATLEQIRGGRDQYIAWLSANKQTEQDVRDAVRHELLATAMRDRIIEQLPRTAEYVHAYHIVLATQPEAQSVLNQLSNGAKFIALAQSLSIDESTSPNGGDLGWFTRGTGSVLWTEVEDAAFALQPGQVSDVITSPIGYHIVKVVERQTRALTAEDMAHIQQTALEQWIANLKTNANIEKFI
ncbi:MAG: peptidylprolyl isomerase [Chloroflexi bacterium]|nr:peptidylprolyl isomerase [Chloroflexota bacterium]